MNELHLRGYVTPEDFSGTETERLQKALDFAAESDICKVVLSGAYHADAPLTIPQNMYLVIDGTLHADVQNRITDSFSFEQDRIYIEGSCITGNVTFRHARHVVLEKVQVQGDVTFEFARDLRLEEADISGKLTLGRGCGNVIAQKLRLGSALLTSKSEAADILGREPTLRNVALRDSHISEDVALIAAGDFGLLNVQIDHCRVKDVRIGGQGEACDPKLYTNLTVSHLNPEAWVISRNPLRGSHIAP